MIVSPIVYALLPVVSTFLGGYVVYQWKKDLHPWLFLSGGILLGVAFLDLLPEALARAQSSHTSIPTITTAALLAILFFHVFDNVFTVHAHHEHADGEPVEPCDNQRHVRTRAWTRALGFVFHSFCDGLAIGGGFAADASLGFVILIAVVMHDFSDGMSTVTILKNAFGKKAKPVLGVLVLDALAPFVGSIVGLRLAPSESLIAIALATFSGFFIFLALSELLPQAHTGSTSRQRGVILTCFGILIVAIFRSIADV